MRLSAAIVAFLAFITIHTARADSIASQLPIGSSYEGTIQVSRTKVPLPSGKWTVTALNESRNNQNNVIAFLTMANITNGKFLGHVSIGTNVDLGAGGWEFSRFCSRKDVYFIQTDAHYQREQACWGINHIIMEATSNYQPTHGKNIRQTLSELGIIIPKVMINTTFRFANDHSFITYEILLNPEYFGFSLEGESTWANSPWHKDLIMRTPERQKFLEQVKEQHAAFYPMLKNQFR
ncbi:hypothetical protein [Azospirillum brasilense]|nr:hypothetical protein [Azospirillum brasilense]